MKNIKSRERRKVDNLEKPKPSRNLDNVNLETNDHEKFTKIDNNYKIDVTIVERKDNEKVQE